MKGSVTDIPQEKYLRVLKEMNPDWYSLHFTIRGENVLHFAASKGYAELARQILIRGCTDLLWGRENFSRMYPIQTAEMNEKFSTAEVLLRSTKDRFGEIL